MLFEFITANREKLIALTRAKVAKRLSPKPTKEELKSGVPLFLDQLVEALRHTPSMKEAMESGAMVHGAALLSRGYYGGAGGSRLWRHLPSDYGACR